MQGVKGADPIGILDIGPGRRTRPEAVALGEEEAGFKGIDVKRLEPEVRGQCDVVVRIMVRGVRLGSV